MFTELDISLASDLPQVPVRAEVDPVRMSQVIGNLLQNAAKFTPAGGKVSVALRAAGAEAEIRVRDSGAGIAPQLMDSLFQPFAQGEQTLARIPGGIGLGLAMVKGILELHGGGVQALSGGAGQGSTFLLRVPRLDEEPDATGARVKAAAAVTPRRILVVDDNRDAAQSLAHLLDFYGHCTTVAYDGASAIEKAHAMVPDAVLCDLGLPGMSGFDVARQLRAERPDLRLIAVSGYARPEDAAEAMRAGFDCHVAKPAGAELVNRLLR